MHKPPRLTADEFLAKIEQAPSYALVMNAVYEEMELIVRDEAGEVKGFLGPDPDKTDADELIAFLEKLEVLVNQNADIPESGQTEYPRLTTEEFFAKIEGAASWSVEKFGDTDDPDLLIMSSEGKLERYIGPEVSKMTSPELLDFNSRVNEFILNTKKTQ